MATDGELRCYNKGCGKFYNEDENHDGACCFHPGVPVFHDALKGWSCCKRRTTDFTDFLHIPGCTTALHSNVKPPEPVKEEAVVEDVPEVVKVEPAPMPAPLKTKDIAARPSADSPRQTLKFVVGASLKAALAKLPAVVPTVEESKSSGDATDKGSEEIKLGAKCKHHACAKTYTGPESLSELCRYHPGEAIFHEGLKFWTCCAKKTSDFEQFMRQEGCRTGDHDWPKPRDDNSVEDVKCRYDWHQMGNSVVVSIYSKVSIPDHSTVEANTTVLSADILFNGGKSKSNLVIELFDTIDPEASRVTYLESKVEIKLCKAEPGSWKTLYLPKPKPAVADKTSSTTDSSDDDDDDDDE